MDEDTLYAAAIAGDADARGELEIKADRLNEYEHTILHTESINGNAERVRFILSEFSNKKLLVKLGNQKETALSWAAYYGHTQVVELLIGAARHIPPSANDNPITSFQAFLRHADQDKDTALHVAAMTGNVAIVKLLVEADPTDTHIQNLQGRTPMYIAVERGYNDIVEIISTTCTAQSLDGPDGNTALRIKNLDQGKNPGGTLYEIYDAKEVLYADAIAGDADAISKLEMEADRLNKYEETILHVESKKGNTEHVRFILREFAHKNLLVKLDNQKETALTWAAYYGHTQVAEVLIDAARHLPPAANDNPLTSFQAFLRLGDKDMDTALHIAVINNHIAIVKLLVEADPSDRHKQNNEGKTPVYIAVKKGYKEIVKLICTSCTAPSLEGPGGKTALHAAIKNPDHDTEVVEVLIGAARLLYSSSDDDNTHSLLSSFQAFLRRGDKEMNTALHRAVMQGNLATAKLLVEADPSDRHKQNNEGKTPMFIAAENGYTDIVKLICITCTSQLNLDGPGGSTALHAAIKNLHIAKKEVRDVIGKIIDTVKRAGERKVKHADKSLLELFNKTDEDRCTILELAVERNNLDVVELILAENPVYQLGKGRALIGLMPLIYKAFDKEYSDILKLLTQCYERETAISSLDGNMVSLISAIKMRETESVFSLLDNYAEDLVTFTDNLGWTALHHAAYHEFDSIIYVIVKAQKEFGHQFVYQDMVSTPFHIAAEKGFTSTVILLMQFWPSSSSAYSALDKNGQNILHIAALQGKKEMIQGILRYCPEEYKNKFVNEPDKNGNTPLHLLILRGCFIPELLRYEGLDIKVENKQQWTPRDMLYFEDQIIEDQVQIKIVLDGIQNNMKRDIFSSSVLPSKRMRKDMIFNEQAKLMMREKHARMKEDSNAIADCFVDAITGDAFSKGVLEMEADTPNEEGKTILHVESMRGDSERVRYIAREFANKNLLVKLDRYKQTALHLASHHGHTRVVEVLLDAARHLPDSSSFQAFIGQAAGPTCNTALHEAVLNDNVAVVKLLVEAGPSDRHIQNYQGKTPVYIAAENGYKDIIKVICTTCTALSLEGPGGKTTALHALIKNIEKGEEVDIDVIRMIINAAKRWSSAEDAPNGSFKALFNRRDESGHTLLELAVYGNHLKAVELILLENPAYQDGHGSKNHSLMRLIYKAGEEYSMDIVKLLAQTYEAGINPQHKGVLTLIHAIKRRDRESILGLLEGNNKHVVDFVDQKGWTPLHYAAYHEFDLILDVIIEAQEDIGYQFVCEDMISTPFHIAAKYGYTSTLIRLMQMRPVSSLSSPYTSINKKGQNILHLAAVNNKKEMIHGILKYCPEKYKDQISSQKDSNGNTPLHLLISEGCFISELIKKGLDTTVENKNGWTPLDMLYFQNEIVGEQAQIKIALDDMQTNQSYGNFLLGSMKKNIFETLVLPRESLVLPSRRERKNVLFNEYKNSLMDAKDVQMKKELQIYRQGTNSQIVVSALITTITFTVGFTMPGGLHQSGEVGEGSAVLSKKAAFHVFMVLDALALLLSTCSMFIYFLESLYEDPYQVFSLHATTTVLNIVSVMLMMLIFMTGTYVVLSHSLALAITVCVIGSLFFVFVIVHLMKFVHVRRVQKNKD